MAEYERDKLEVAFRRAVEDGENSIANQLYRAIQNLPTAQDEASLPPFDTQGNFIPSESKKDEAVPLYEKIVGAGETALTLGTGATTGVLGGIAGAGMGLYDSIVDGSYGTPEGAKSVEERFNQGAADLTYLPSSEKGVEYVGDIGETLQQYATPFMGFGGELANITTLGKTGLSPTILNPKNILPDKKLSLEQRGLQQSQNLLQEGNGGLTAFQTENSGKIRNFVEKIGQIGLVSRARYQNQRQRNTDFISKQFQDMVNGKDPRLAASKMDVGDTVMEIVSEGKRAAGDIYGSDLASLVTEFGQAKVDVRPVVNNLRAYLKKNESDFGSALNKGTVSYINELISRLESVAPSTITSGLGGLTTVAKGKKPVIPALKGDVQSLLEFEKKVSGEIRDKGDFRIEGFNPSSSRELAQVSSELRDSINRVYSSQGLPDLAGRHLSAKTTYGKLLDSLNPDSIEGLIKGAAKSDNAEGIGKLLLNADSPTKINSLMKSIDTAFPLLKRTGRGTEGYLAKSSSEFKDMVRQSYLKELLGEVPVTSNELYTGKYTGLYNSLSSPSNSLRVKAVLGNGYGSYKRLTRALRDSSREQKGDPMSLAIRSLEFGAGLGVVAGAFTGGMSIPVSSLAAILAPSVLSRWASNPKAVNTLLKLRKLDMNNSKTPTHILGTIETIITSMPYEEDRKAAREAISKAKKQRQQ